MLKGYTREFKVYLIRSPSASDIDVHAEVLGYIIEKIIVSTAYL